ncbi:hypothetical protein ACYFX5_12805 [Bremerella sp. T1]|uniref:hypothetical protein n=1 Tax=Bremerella sp. TYQ1 TaxID=3119568 RepID=UPI001CCEE374|nr:hypothetical protein [Bremerella volcania]UBM33940.1 hypothetical protein LA756_14750 [Bremerella volcania]
MKTYLSLAGIVLGSLLGCSPPVIDASSDEALIASMNKVLEGATEEECNRLVEDINFLSFRNGVEIRDDRYAGIDGHTSEEIQVLAAKRREELEARDAMIRDVLAKIDEGLAFAFLSDEGRMERDVDRAREAMQDVISKYDTDVAKATSQEERLELQWMFLMELEYAKSDLHEAAVALDAWMKKNAKGIIID